MAGSRDGGEGRIALLAIVGFLALASWLVYGSVREQEPVQPPYSSYSGNAAGVRAIYELLDARGHEVSRHTLSEHEYPPGHCVVIADESTLNPIKMMVNTLDVMALDLYLQDGGSVVLFCDSDLALLSEIEEMLLRDQAGEAADEEPQLAIARRVGTGRLPGNAAWRGSMGGRLFELAADRPPLFRDVNRLELADSWTPAVAGFSSVLALEQAYGHPPFEQFVGYARHGQGTLVVVNRPEIITNSWIDRADNHRLVLALIEAAAAGRPILFDEQLHGFNAVRMTAGSLLTRSTGGHLVLLAVLCIIMMFLGQAIMPARFLSRKAPPRRQAAEIVLGQASLFQRAGFERGSLRHIVDGLKHELMRSHDFAGLPHDHELLLWARQNMPHNWKMEAALEDFLRSGSFPASRATLQRSSQSCDAMRLHIWRRSRG